MPPQESPQFQNNNLLKNNSEIGPNKGPVDLDLNNEKKQKKPLKWYQFEQELKPLNIVMLLVFHILGCSTFLHSSLRLDYFTFRMWTFHVFYTYLTGLGVTGGVHRLWTHRSYTASKPWRYFLVLCFMGTGQNRVSEWVLDHRVHHKYSETEADPHNANRGFFFAHCGWLMMKKSPEVIKKGKLIDMSDVMNDPVVQFAEKYYWWLKLFLAYVLPITLTMYFFNATFYVALIYRMGSWCLLLNGTWSVNSAAHLWGMHPYDKRINPAENMFVSLLSAGEGFHNYHHIFPWDYKAAESPLHILNGTTVWIDLAAKFGLVSNRKQASKDLIEKTILKYGDGSHGLSAKQLPSFEVDQVTEKIVMDY